MQILEVIPLAMLPPHVPQLLSYFFDRELPTGAVVRVPVGNRAVTAVVVSSTPLEREKAALKRTDFQLKKISAVVSETPQADRSQLNLALWISKQYFAPLGQSLKTVLPPFFSRRGYRAALPSKTKRSPSPYKPLIIVSRAKESAERMRPFILQTLQDGGQALLVAPELASAQYFADALADLKPTLLHGGMRPKEHAARLEAIASGDARLVIGTRIALFAPFKDLLTVLVDDPSHEFYRSDMTPRYNTPDVARKLAERSGARLILVTPTLSANNIHGVENGFYETRDVKDSRRPEVEIIDMAQEIKTGNFSVLSRVFQNMLTESLRRGQRVLLYSSRRAYSGSLACQNCGVSVPCQNCSIPMRVHRSTEDMLVCYRCSAYQVLPSQCPNCASYKLRASGSPGSQKVEETVRYFLDQNGFTNMPTFILDSDLIRTPRQERELVDALRASPSHILIATQMVFSYRHRWDFDAIGVVNADALESAPDFRTQERLLYQLEKLLDFGPNRVLIQTYQSDSPLLAQFRQGNYNAFYSEELSTRKALGYPPFSRLVRLSFGHRDEQKAATEARILAERLKMAIAKLGLATKVQVFGPSPALVAKERGRSISGIVLKLSHTLGSLDTLLKYVPSRWLIDVDPRSVV